MTTDEASVADATLPPPPEDVMRLTTVHTTTFVGRCPHGGADVYRAEFHVSGRVLTVERIQEAIEELTAVPVYQENLTRSLAARLGCRVVTSGTHGRFATRCQAGRADGRFLCGYW